MQFTEALIAEYAKKIYGFAYDKTRNCHDADDLSQEILLNLCGISFPERQIHNMDAYIYHICLYTWGNYDRVLCLDRLQREKLDEILTQTANALLDREEIDRVYRGYADHMRTYFPDYLSENERNHYLTSYDPYNAVLYCLVRTGKLKSPGKEDRKSICTILWQI